MLKHIEEFGTCIEITGFKNVKIRNAGEFLGKISKEKPSGVEVQFFDARFVATWEHLYFAVLNALTSFGNEENISKSLAMETLLYAAAERQITKATKMMGVKPITRNVAVVIFGKENRKIRSVLSIISKNLDGQCDEMVLELSKEKSAAIQKAFNVSRAELRTIMEKNDVDKALVDLVVERMALLSTRR